MAWRLHTGSLWEWVFRELFATTRQPRPYKAAGGSSASGGNCESLPMPGTSDLHNSPPEVAERVCRRLRP